MTFEIEIFPPKTHSVFETITIDPELMKEYETLIEYVQEVHCPQFEWEFVN